ncbi:hypothetical protein [Streptomyces sp. NPDC046939]|uniref:hypothetical protein n=1 Tax=Streptomyces sp. NPDC046939 TaxID=3155376 RepID=UPI0033E6BB96
MSYDRSNAAPMVARGLRILPWESDMGHACYLAADPEQLGYSRSVVSRLADRIEDGQLTDGAHVLQGARAVLDDPKAGKEALRRSLALVTRALGDVLRVADSRGARLTPPAIEDAETGADQEEDDG